MLPAQYRWLEAEPGPRMIAEALKQYGTLELPGEADNPKIIGWQDELEAAGLDDSKLALVGFSQGTMMALHVGLRRRRAPRAWSSGARAWTGWGRGSPKREWSIAMCACKPRCWARKVAASASAGMGAQARSRTTRYMVYRRA